MAEINRALSRSRLLSPKQSGHLLYIIKGSYSEAYRPVRSMHCHDFLEVHYAAEGSSSCVIEQEAVVTEPGMLLIYNAGEFHAENPHRDSLSAFYSIAFDQIKMPDLPENHLIRPGHSHAIRLDRYESLFCALVNSCYYESKSREDRISPATRAMADLILELILKLLGESSELLPDQENETEFSVERIRRYLCYHFDEDVTLESIASMMHSSTSTVSHSFRKELGISPIQYLQRIRIGEAQTLLGSSDLSIRDIALRVGYNSAENMYLAFRKHTGMSPSRYRDAQKHLQTMAKE